MKSFIMALLLTLAAAPAFAQNWISPLDLPQPEGRETFLAVVEIPAGSLTKYELDPETGLLMVDRFQSMPVLYPANYGAVPSSLGGDGDSLDVLIYTREPLAPGAVIKLRPVGVLTMIDGGEADDKIIAVPSSQLDPTYDGLKEAADLPAMELERLQAFFRVYKQLPQGRKEVELKGIAGSEEAWKRLEAAFGKYREAKSAAKHSVGR